jgi:hypothetical protein
VESRRVPSMSNNTAVALKASSDPDRQILRGTHFVPIAVLHGRISNSRPRAGDLTNPPRGCSAAAVSSPISVRLNHGAAQILRP